MSARAFHHGNLRAEILAHARVTLREAGEEGLSLRQLARDAGVSHAAPRRHFPERQDLLNALAEQGFDELTASIAEQLDRAGGDRVTAFRAVARSYIDFAIRDGALMTLMFSAKNGTAAAGVSEAADRFFAAVGTIVAAVVPSPSAPAPSGALSDALRAQLLLASTLHGIASLLCAGRLDASQVDELIDGVGQLFGVGAQPAAK
ncbi:TetR/AcrR family transcriptional regulator [Amycolatopsis sp. Hca4]|uniref:TetR/AcrR family transcriptional regulator n=1 Tax=Amycolatopsis sp. Hca4 TaxID=2742131 RepID=UPI0015913B06|nr:TetR/AcrR family transcriptional regulator [Amycolatopsis sp. Hca4]QKV73656.1 TetR/AcrR family transcriptional regulator [Amycolatopsis sp. Hca4]